MQRPVHDVGRSTAFGLKYRSNSEGYQQHCLSPVTGLSHDGGRIVAKQKADPLKVLVFSDLDGTLLDHETYTWDAAVPGLERLRAIGAGLVLASSKTAAEIIPLQKELGCDGWPAIVENGAGVVWPDSPIDSADSYSDIRQKLMSTLAGSGLFHGFGDMSAQEVVACTGLSPQAALLAKQRQFSEPGLWRGTPRQLESFLAELRSQGLDARQGGRFLTISHGHTKADGMAQIIKRLKPQTTIALGDAPNDVDMIEAADHGVIIANPQGAGIATLPSEQQGKIIRTKEPGPQGWAQAIMSLTAPHQPPTL